MQNEVGKDKAYQQQRDSTSTDEAKWIPLWKSDGVEYIEYKRV